MNKLEEVLDIDFHFKKQKLDLNTLGIYETSKHHWKVKNGTNKHYTSSIYQNKEQEKHDYSVDNIWTIGEAKINYNKRFKQYKI